MVGFIDEPGTRIIAFRGSHEPRDFIYDLRFFFKDVSAAGYNEERVHHGFNIGYQSAE